MGTQQRSGFGQPAIALWVGTYSEQGGRGLYPVNCSQTGEWTAGEAYEAAKNASFSAWSARHGLHYLVDELGGRLGVYRYADGWTQLASMDTGGSQPCYVSLNADETLLAVANYGSGSMALFSLDAETGRPGGRPEDRSNSGSGPIQD